ncbi:MAG: hydrogenase maturation factor [Sulfurimonas sp.]|jgi:hydrogenase maturation factor
MCLINIGRVLEVKEEKALCDFDGVLKEISIVLLPMIKIGDDISVNSGFASEIIKDKKGLYQTMISTDSLATQVLNAIQRECNNIDKKEIKIAIFSDTQNYLIKEAGVQELLPQKINLISAPNAKLVSSMNDYVKKHKIDGAISSIYLFKEIIKKDNFIFTDDQAIDILKAILEILINFNQKEEYEK